jgi:hypothetical protein
LKFLKASEQDEWCGPPCPPFWSGETLRSEWRARRPAPLPFWEVAKIYPELVTYEADGKVMAVRYSMPQRDAAQ